MSEFVCIYHANCADGFGAAYAFWKAFGDTAHYIPAQYRDEPPYQVVGRHVYILDFSYRQDVMREIAAEAEHVTVLDHHKTAREDLASLFEEKVIDGVFDMNRSGAVIAWNYLHPEKPVPRLLKYIQDRDLWRWELDYSKEISAALRSYPMDFRVWDDLMDNILRLKKEGEALERSNRQQIAHLKTEAFYRKIDGYNVPVINAYGPIVSELAGELSEGEPFAAAYQVVSDGVIFSLRSSQDGLDVSEIAKKFGGGGHKHAAGFKVDIKDLWELLGVNKK